MRGARREDVRGDPLARIRVELRHAVGRGWSSGGLEPALLVCLVVDTNVKSIGKEEMIG